MNSWPSYCIHRRESQALSKDERRRFVCDSFVLNCERKGVPAQTSDFRGTQTTVTGNRAYNHQNFCIGGAVVCKTAFLFSACVSPEQYKHCVSLFDKATETGKIYPNHLHGSAGNKYAVNASVDRCVDFIRLFATENGYPNPAGRSGATEDQAEILLPPSILKKHVHEVYKASCIHDEVGFVQKSRLVKRINPQILRNMAPKGNVR
jgi:hypothetical protein